MTEAHKHPSRLVIEVEQLDPVAYLELVQTLGRLGVAYTPLFKPRPDEALAEQFEGPPKPFGAETNEPADFAVTFRDIAATAALYQEEFAGSGAAERAWNSLTRYLKGGERGESNIIAMEKPDTDLAARMQWSLSFSKLSALAVSDIRKHSRLRYAFGFGDKSYYLLRLTLEHKRRQIERHQAGVAAQ